MTLQESINNLIELGQTALKVAKSFNDMIHSLDRFNNISNGFYFDLNQEDNNYVL
jgi:hypothetical protein